MDTPTLAVTGFFIVCIVELVWRSRRKSQARQLGDDAYYASKAKERSIFHCVVVYASADESSFQKEMAAMSQRIQDFAKTKLPEASDGLPLFAEVAHWDEWTESKRRTVDVCVWRYQVATRTLAVTFNHAICGGADFLQAACVMFKGQSSQLITPPNILVGSLCMLQFAAHVARHAMVSPNSIVQGRDDPKHWRRMVFSISKDTLPSQPPNGYKSRISTRTQFAHCVLTTVCECFRLPNNRPLRTWFTVGFKRVPGMKLRNTVGIIATEIQQGDSLQGLEKRLSKQKHHALGSYFLQSMTSGTAAARNGSKARSWVDIVVSMAHITDAEGPAVSCVQGSTEYGMPYPLYLSMLTLNDTCFCSLTIASELFDPSPLLQKFPGAMLPRLPWEHNG